MSRVIMHSMAGGGYSYCVSYPDGSYARVVICRGDGRGGTWDPTQEHELQALGMVDDLRRAVLFEELPSSFEAFLDQEIGA